VGGRQAQTTIAASFYGEGEWPAGSGGAALIGLGGALAPVAVGERAGASSCDGVGPHGEPFVEPADAAGGVEVGRGVGVGGDGIVGERADDGAARGCVRKESSDREHAKQCASHVSFMQIMLSAWR
jgi:hypothetical protein